MQTQRHWLNLSLALLLISLMSVLVKGDATSDLEELQDQFHRWRKHVWPFFGASVEDRIEEAFAAHLAKVKEYDTKLSAIDRGQLGRRQQHSYDVLQHMLSTKVDNYRWRNYGPLNPVSFIGGFYLRLDAYISRFRFSTIRDYMRFIFVMRGWVIQINQMMVMMNKAIRLKTTHHLVSVQEVPGILSALTSATPEESNVYQPFKTKLDSLNISQGDRNALRSRGLSAVRNFQNALNRLRTYMNEKYKPNTRTTFGVYGLPSGKDYYRACVKWHLSYNVTPEEVQQTGLREVTRITQLMRQIMRSHNFEGTIRQYFNKLDNDPSFQLDTSEKIIQGFTDLIQNRAYPKLPMVFKNIPSHPVEVKPAPHDGLYAFYRNGSEDGSRPGYFFVRTTRPSDTKTYNMISLTLHETVPGHHLQFAYSAVSDLPAFRKRVRGKYSNVPFEFPFFTSFSEGWGLYSEYLGEQMGVYRNDSEMMGRYGYEMLRACRLVVDTGIHYYGWSRQKAITYMYRRMSSSRNTVEGEVDRYITVPGQALAYKMGELKIKQLRQMAENQLGTKFDIREFHSQVLTNGRLPLGVLENIIKDYIAGTLAESSTGI